MISIRQWIARLSSYFRRPELDRDLDAELAAHLDLAIEDNLKRGMSPDEARRNARISLGGVEAAKELQRDIRGLPLLDALLQDLRHSIRMLRRDTGLATFAILIVGLGVGASSTVFSVVNALLVRPLPFENPDQLAWIANDGDPPGETVQVGHVTNMRTNSKSFSDIAGYFWFYSAGNTKLTGKGEPERLTGVPVSCNFYPLLGIRPALGRLFNKDECKFNGPGAVVLGYRLWARRFASDPSIIGRTLTLNDAPTTVVGVLPASFDFASIFAPGTRVDFFRPFPFSAETNRRGNTLAVVGRLKPGATVEQAQVEATVLMVASRRDHPELNEFHPRVGTLRERVSGGLRRAILVLACAVGLVMLIVCANLSNLLLARTMTREKEIAIRAALGAGRWRLVRQVLTESVVLSSAGAALGLVLAILGTRLLSHLDAVSIPLLEQIRLDRVALAFTLLMAVSTGILFGLTPALRMSALALHDALKENSRGTSEGRSHGWIRGALVVSEIALTCMLLVAAGLMARSFLRVLDVDLGFQPQSALAVRVDPSAQYFNQAGRNAYYDEALRRVRSASGVESAGLTDALPMSSDRSWGIVFAEGQTITRENSPEAYVRVVSDGYMRAMGIPLLAGRDFTPTDTPSSQPAIIINDTLARTLWPGQDAVGKKMRTDFVVRQVVGVVSGVRHVTVESEAGNEMYLPIRQTTDYASVTLIARGEHSEADLRSGVREALRTIDPTLPLNEFSPIQEIVDRAVSPRRLIVMLLLGFAAFALILASLGIYGVISYSVSRRRQDIGIRMALGASARDLQQGIMLQTMKLVAAGITVGVVASWIVGRLIAGLLFGVTSTDPATFAAMLGILISVAALAGYLPARRASRLDPVNALRSE